MGFEVFVKGSAPVPRVPSVTIQKSGVMSMNRAAHALIGAPDFVELLWDGERRIVGVRPAVETNPNAYPARPQQVNAEKGPLLVATAKFVQFVGLDVSQSMRYVPYAEDGILCVDVSKPGQLVSSNRSGKSIGAALVEMINEGSHSSGSVARGTAIRRVDDTDLDGEITATSPRRRIVPTRATSGDRT